MKTILVIIGSFYCQVLVSQHLVFPKGTIGICNDLKSVLLNQIDSIQPSDVYFWGDSLYKRTFAINQFAGPLYINVPRKIDSLDQISKIGHFYIELDSIHSYWHSLEEKSNLVIVDIKGDPFVKLGFYFSTGYSRGFLTLPVEIFKLHQGILTIVEHYTISLTYDKNAQLISSSCMLINRFPVD